MKSIDIKLAALGFISVIFIVGCGSTQVDIDRPVDGPAWGVDIHGKPKAPPEAILVKPSAPKYPTFGGKTAWTSDEFIHHVKGKTTKEILSQFGKPKKVTGGGTKVFYWSYSTRKTVTDTDSKKVFGEVTIYFSGDTKRTLDEPVLFHE